MPNPETTAPEVPVAPQTVQEDDNTKPTVPPKPPGKPHED